MVPQSRRADASLEKALFERGHDFDFFQAVRLLQRMYPRRSMPGGTARPPQEFARFAAHASLAFPASAIHRIERDPAGGPVQVFVTFLALTGTQGILPFFYTERLLASKTAKDDVLAAFFDLFNHRLLSLFYRAWLKHRPAVLFESGPASIEGPDDYTQRLFDLIGMGTRGLLGRLEVRDESLLLYAGLIAQRPHSAVALHNILRDYFRVPVEIDQCLGDWYPLGDADRCVLGRESESDRAGEGAILGDQVWNQQSRFRLRVGALPLECFLEFLPGGCAMRRLVDWTRYFTGQALAFDVQVILAREEVPFCRLDDEGPDAPRLGWMGWLRTGETPADAPDAVFRWTN
jgi:type VI secretion system protein ImpH